MNKLLESAKERMDEARTFLVDTHYVGREDERQFTNYTPAANTVVTLALLLAVLDTKVDKQ